MIDAKPYPLHWPTWKKRVTPKAGRFRVKSIGHARDELLRELRIMKVSQAVISTNVALRRDGLPHSDASNPRDAGVAVYFVRKNRQQVIAIDTFAHVRDNLHAAARVLEFLRGVERYGGQVADQAFQGFAALPPAGGAQEPARHWREVLNVPETLGLPPGDQRIIAEAHWRDMVDAAHPDKGGDPEQAPARIAELNGARARMREEFGL